MLADSCIRHIYKTYAIVYGNWYSETCLKRNLNITETCLQRKMFMSPRDLDSRRSKPQIPVLNETFLERKNKLVPLRFCNSASLYN